MEEASFSFFTHSLELKIHGMQPGVQLGFDSRPWRSSSGDNPEEILNPFQNPTQMVKIGTQQRMRPGGKSYVQESSAPSDKIYQVICLP